MLRSLGIGDLLHFDLYSRPSYGMDLHITSTSDVRPESWISKCNIYTLSAQGCISMLNGGGLGGTYVFHTNLFTVLNTPHN